MQAYLSLGSNIRPQKNIPACVKKLREAFHVRKISSIYETSPIGPVGKHNFWNLAVSIETKLPRPQLVRALHAIEYDLGRVRSPRRFAPRPIDIDLILCGRWRRKGFEKFAFVVVPLGEILPRFRRPFRDPRQKIKKRERACSF